MRSTARRRSVVLAVTALATTFAAAGCGGDEEGASDSEVTIWSSVDQPVQDGLEAVLTEKADAEGYTINWQKVENINQLIMTKIQANDTPDIALIPQPGVVADIRRAARPSRSTTSSTWPPSRSPWCPARSTPAWSTTSSTACSSR